MRALSIMELERLIGIMRQMQHYASSANWDELARLDDERRALLKYDAVAASAHAGSQAGLPSTEADVVRSDQEQQFDNLHPGPNDSLQKSLVREIKILDKQIINQAQAARDKLLVQNRGLNAQVKAKKLYAQTNSIT